MTTTSLAAHAANARQQLANVLAKLQSNPNVPQSVLDVLSGLARAMGPLFQLERGSQDNNLFIQARTVLQETLEKIQAADQSHPGVSDATEAVAGALGTIFKALKEAGMVPAPGGSAGAQPAAQPSAPRPSPSQNAMQAQAPASQPIPLTAPKPSASQSAMPVQSAPAAAKPFASAPQPFAVAGASASASNAKPAASTGAAGGPPRSMSSAGMSAQGPAGITGAHRAAVAASVPTGPNGMPRLESEIGVHSETNFYTDFLGDIRNNGGIFVATFHVLPIGTACEVFLTFPGNLTAEIRGTVKWKRESDGTDNASPGLGIEITQAPPEAWNLINRFIAKREPIMHEM